MAAALRGVNDHLPAFEHEPSWKLQFDSTLLEFDTASLLRLLNSVAFVEFTGFGYSHHLSCEGSGKRGLK
jgi:hypothetical protein